MQQIRHGYREVTPEEVQRLRAESGYGFHDCKVALKMTDTYEEAVALVQGRMKWPANLDLIMDLRERVLALETKINLMQHY